MINQSKYGRVNILKLFVSIAIVLFACVAASAAPDDEYFVLTVNVTNGTANGKSVSGDDITVRIFEHEKLVKTSRGKVGDDGKAVFTDIPRREHLILYPKVEHNGTLFKGPTVGLNPERQHANIYVDVFENSYDNSFLKVVTQHFKIEQKGNFLVLSEFIQLKNSSNFAISSKTKDRKNRSIVLTIPLPKGFRNFTCSDYLASESLVFTDEGFYDTMVVPPGDHKLVFSYNLKIKPSDMDIVKKISLSTSYFIIFSQLEPGSIQGLGKPDGKVVLPGGVATEYYDRGAISAGEQITFKVVGLIVNNENRNLWIVVAVIFGILMILALTRLLPAKKHERTITK